jgi:hypothetical protein
VFHALLERLPVPVIGKPNEDIVLSMYKLGGTALTDFTLIPCPCLFKKANTPLGFFGLITP